MAQNDNRKGHRDKHGRFTEEGASYYGRLGGEASRKARQNRRNKSKSGSNMRDDSNTGFNE